MEGNGESKITNGSSLAAASTVSGSVTTFSDESEARAREDTHLRSGFCQDLEEENLDYWLWLIGIDSEQVSIDFDTDELMAITLLDDGNVSAASTVHGLVDIQPDANLLGSHNPMDYEQERLGLLLRNQFMNEMIDDDNMSAPDTVRGQVDNQPNFSYERQYTDANSVHGRNDRPCKTYVRRKKAKKQHK